MSNATLANSPAQRIGQPIGDGIGIVYAVQLIETGQVILANPRDVRIGDFRFDLVLPPFNPSPPSFKDPAQEGRSGDGKIGDLPGFKFIHHPLAVGWTPRTVPWKV